MVQRVSVPFNVSLLSLTPQRLSSLRPVTSLDILDGLTNNFAEDGLYSTSIFGKVGDIRRSKRFSYIDIKVTIFHPVIYRALVSMKKIYAGIMAGTVYAVWNNEIKDFEKSDAVDGSTGFQFFVSKWESIGFAETKSVVREQFIALIKKYKTVAMSDKIVVMPAGLRDAELLPDDRIQKDEINDHYSRILSISNTVSESAVKGNPEILDTARQKLQQEFNALYENIENRIQGKKKLLLGKWASRRVMNGTRNVITAMDTSSPYLGGAGAPKFNNTVIGLYQMMKAALPVSIYELKNGFLSEVFTGPDQPVRLINKTTLKSESVHLKTDYFNRFMTDEGLEKVITSFSSEGIRHKPLEIDGKYVGLIYKGPDNTYRLLHDIDEVISTRDKKDVYPVTLCELLYLSVQKRLNKLPLFFTRYPITGTGSIYPSIAYVKTTVLSESRKQLSESWEPMTDDDVAHEFPVTGAAFISSLVPHSARLSGLTADFDGDTASANVTYSDESVQEVTKLLTMKKAYVGTDGNFLASTAVSTVELVMHNLTGP